MQCCTHLYIARLPFSIPVILFDFPYICDILGQAVGTITCLHVQLPRQLQGNSLNVDNASFDSHLCGYVLLAFAHYEMNTFLFYFRNMHMKR